MDIYHLLNKSFFDSCSKIDGLWRKRNRSIDTKLILLFLMKIISGKNNHGYSYIINEIWAECTREKIPLPQHNPVSASSMYEARMKLPDNAIKTINKNIISVWEDNAHPETWKGHRLFAIDGSKLNIPRGLLEDGYKIPKNTSRHYPYAMMSCLYDVLNFMVYDIDFVEHNNERACAKKHLECLGCDSVVIFDRGYFSYYLLYQVIQNNLNAVFRVQEGKRNKTISDFSNSSSNDLVVSYTPSEAVKSDLRKRKLLSEFPSLTLRLIKHTDQNGEYILATTLIERAYYETEAFHDLYHHRWNIEELYKLSKSILSIEDFHSQSEKGVKQEIQAHILLLNLTRITGNDINHRDNNDVCISSRENKPKLNFKNCLFLVVRNLFLLIHGIGKHLKSFCCALSEGLVGMTQRVRPGRHYPRKSMRPRTRWNSFDAPART